MSAREVAQVLWGMGKLAAAKMAPKAGSRQRALRAPVLRFLAPSAGGSLSERIEANSCRASLEFVWVVSRKFTRYSGGQF